MDSERHEYANLVNLPFPSTSRRVCKGTGMILPCTRTLGPGTRSRVRLLLHQPPPQIQCHNTTPRNASTTSRKQHRTVIVRTWGSPRWNVDTTRGWGVQGARIFLFLFCVLTTTNRTTMRGICPSSSCRFHFDAARRAQTLLAVSLS